MNYMENIYVNIIKVYYILNNVKMVSVRYLRAARPRKSKVLRYITY